MHSLLKATLFTALPVVREVLRAILEESGGHSNTGQQESANASHLIRDRYRGGPDSGLLRPLTIAAIFVCSEDKDRDVRRSEPSTPGQDSRNATQQFALAARQKEGAKA
jgi:hypothetical protein